LTSRQNPDRASPARPRRDHTPAGVVRAALGPGPVARVHAESCINPTRSPDPQNHPHAESDITLIRSHRSSNPLLMWNLTSPHSIAPILEPALHGKSDIVLSHRPILGTCTASRPTDRARCGIPHHSSWMVSIMP